MATLEAHRMFYAELITSSVGMPKSRLTSAFKATPREHHLGPGPWKVFTARGYIQTPSDDPAFALEGEMMRQRKDSLKHSDEEIRGRCVR
jgi:protein-L-isoaspartate(D-aspartate) O-methyltransferase